MAGQSNTFDQQATGPGVSQTSQDLMQRLQMRKHSLIGNDIVFSVPTPYSGVVRCVHACSLASSEFQQAPFPVPHVQAVRHKYTAHAQRSHVTDVPGTAEGLSLSAIPVCIQDIRRKHMRRNNSSGKNEPNSSVSIATSLSLP